MSSSLNEEMVQLDSHLTAVRAFQRPCYSRSVGMQPFTFCPCRQGLFPEVAGSALLPLTGWRSSSLRYFVTATSIQSLSLETFCLRVREDILFHCEYRSHLPHGLFPSTLTTQCNLSLVRRVANWRASFVTLRGRLVLPQSLPPSHALLGDSSMPPLTSRRATTTALRAPP